MTLDKVNITSYSFFQKLQELGAWVATRNGRHGIREVISQLED